jgi:hypothetical protein
VDGEHHQAAVRVGSPCVPRAGQHDAVARVEPHRSRVQQEVYLAGHDEIEVDRLGPVHRRLVVRWLKAHDPADVARRHVKVAQACFL